MQRYTSTEEQIYANRGRYSPTEEPIFTNRGTAIRQWINRYTPKVKFKFNKFTCSTCLLTHTFFFFLFSFFLFLFSLFSFVATNIFSTCLYTNTYNHTITRFCFFFLTTTFFCDMKRRFGDKHYVHVTLRFGH